MIRWIVRAFVFYAIVRGAWRSLFRRTPRNAFGYPAYDAIERAAIKRNWDRIFYGALDAPENVDAESVRLMADYVDTPIRVEVRNTFDFFELIPAECAQTLVCRLTRRRWHGRGCPYHAHGYSMPLNDGPARRLFTRIGHKEVER